MQGKKKKAVFFIFLLGGCVGGAAYGLHRINQEGQSFVDRWTVALARTWDLQTFLEASSPELKAIAPADKVKALFQLLDDRFGRYQEFRGARGALQFQPQSGWLNSIQANYTAEMAFEKTVAFISLKMVRRIDGWEILRFHVNSDVLIGDQALGETQQR